MENNKENKNNCAKPVLGAVCQECGGHTDNEGAACKGAISQEYHFNYSFQGLDTRGMITCNCCESCRWKCHDSFMQSMADGEQETNYT